MGVLKREKNVSSSASLAERPHLLCCCLAEW